MRVINKALTLSCTWINEKIDNTKYQLYVTAFEKQESSQFSEVQRSTSLKRQCSTSKLISMSKVKEVEIKI